MTRRTANGQTKKKEKNKSKATSVPFGTWKWHMICRLPECSSGYVPEYPNPLAAVRAEQWSKHHDTRDGIKAQSHLGPTLAGNENRREREGDRERGREGGSPPGKQAGRGQPPLSGCRLNILPILLSSAKGTSLTFAHCTRSISLPHSLSHTLSPSSFARILI